MACFKRDLLKKKFPFTPDEVLSIFKYWKEDYIDHGVPPERAARALASSLGVPPEAIVQAIVEPKGFKNPRRQTVGLWRRANSRANALQWSKTIMEHADSTKFGRVADYLWNIPRGVSILGHFGVFAKTHMADSLLIPGEQANYFRAFRDSWRLAQPRAGAEAFHANEMFKMTSDDNWIKANKAGVDNDPSSSPIGMFSEEHPIHSMANVIRRKLGKPETEAPAKRAAMAFNFIKRGRTEIFTDRSQGLGMIQKARAGLGMRSTARPLTDPADLKVLADVVNHSTGSVKLRPAWQQWMAKFYFAPKLFPAQLMSAFGDPANLLFGKNGLVYGNSTPGTRAAARFVFGRQAKLIAAYSAGLAMNQGIYMATGDDRFKVNFTNPRDTSTWLRPRIFGHGVIASPMIEWLKFPLQMFLIGATSRDPAGDMGKLALKQLFIYRANPVVANLLEAAVGRNLATNQLTPFKGLLPKIREQITGEEQKIGAKEEERRLGTAEYVGGKLPIPAAAGVREFADAMKDEGMPPDITRAWIKGIIGSAVGTSGYHERYAPLRDVNDPQEFKDIFRGPPVRKKEKGEPAP